MSGQRTIATLCNVLCTTLFFAGVLAAAAIENAWIFWKQPPPLGDFVLPDYLVTLHTVAAFVALAAMIGQGMVMWWNLHQHKLTPWTHGNELLFGYERPFSDWEDWREDRVQGAIVATSHLFSFLFVVPVIWFVLDWPNNQNPFFAIGVLCIAVIGTIAGADSIGLLVPPPRRRPFTLTDTGGITAGSFFPWSALSWYAADSQRQIVRVYSRASPEISMFMLRIPDTAVFQHTLTILQQRLSAAPPPQPAPWYRRQGAWLAWFGLFYLLIGMGVVLLALLPNAPTSLILLGGLAFVRSTQFGAMVDKMLGIEISTISDGLQQRGNETLPLPVLQ